MNYDMTVRAHRTQICYWVNFIFVANFRKLPQMMNVNVPFKQFTIRYAKIKITNETSRTVMGNTTAARFWTALVNVDRNLMSCAFNENLCFINFFR